MTTTISIAAERRNTTGKGPARQLRMQGRVPAVIYGRGREPEPLTVSLTEFERVAEHISGATIIDLAIDGRPTKTVIREIQKHPFRPGILHIDFHEIHEGETLTVEVPVVLEGVPLGVRTGGGVLDHSVRELEIEVLPRHLPDRIVVDVSELNIGQSIHVSDLAVEHATILTDIRATVCSVIPPRVEAEEEVEAEEVEEEGAEPELIRKPKAEGDETEE